jgi:hypothetical protein
VRSEVEEPPVVCVPGAGFGGVVPVPEDVPPMDGVAAGLGVGRSDGVPDAPVPTPGAAGVPGFIVGLAPALPPDGDVLWGAGARSSSDCAAAVYPPGGGDDVPGVVSVPERCVIGAVLVEKLPPELLPEKAPVCEDAA